MKQGWVGEYYWTYGPLVLGTEAARKAIAKGLAEADRKALKAAGGKRAPFVPVKVAGHDVVVLPGAHHTRAIAIDAKAAMLIRRVAYVNPSTVGIDQALAYDPGWTTEPWKAVKTPLVVPKGGFVLFDAIAQHATAPQNAERAQESIAVPLVPGRYVVEHVAEQKFGKGLSAQLLYIHPADHRPALSAATAQPAAPAALVIAKDVAAAAKKLRFVESEGGPLVFLPARAAKAWWGVCDEAGDAVYGKKPTHYDRACDAKGATPVLDVGGARALVLRGPDSTALHPTADGALLVRWIGADHAAAVLAPALGPGVFAKTTQTLVSAGEPWLLFDSALDGRALPKRAVATITLPEGTYAVEAMDEWSGAVSLAGKASEVMTTAIRLVRRGQRASTRPSSQRATRSSRATRSQAKPASRSRG